MVFPALPFCHTERLQRVPMAEFFEYIAGRSQAAQSVGQNPSANCCVFVASRRQIAACNRDRCQSADSEFDSVLTRASQSLGVRPKMTAGTARRVGSAL